MLAVFRVSRLFAMRPHPISKWVEAAIFGAQKERPGGKPIRNRFSGNSRWTSSIGGTKSLSAFSVANERDYRLRYEKRTWLVSRNVKFVFVRRGSSRILAGRNFALSPSQFNFIDCQFRPLDERQSTLRSSAYLPYRARFYLRARDNLCKTCVPANPNICGCCRSNSSISV